MTDNNIWCDIENSCYELVQLAYPTPPTTVIGYQNGIEPVTPYCWIDLRKIVAIGREQNDSRAVVVDGVASYTLIENYEATVRFCFVGEDQGNNGLHHGGNLAQKFFSFLQSEASYQFLETVSLSLMRKDSIKRNPKVRETKWYNSYDVDVVFAYALLTTQTVGDIVSTDLTGTYTDSSIVQTINIP